ncbi:unnamed protein product [Mytilus coruscus]|uniref:Uncharacterized protein n=1 Tax=Mytilus coruscus TaxID=42192 RepID=A0A6J8ALA4_MYTCO|nr:unnamed protein product [Mytilus coruscus]
MFTTHSDDNCISQRGHARWVPDEENRFIETLVSDVTKLDEISLLLSEDSNDSKERINTVVDKIGDIFKSTANHVFKPKGRFYPSGSSNQLWFNKKCRDKRKVFHKAKNRYSFKSLNKSNVPDDDIDYEELAKSIKSQGVIEIIDHEFTEDEILSAYKKLCND